MLAVAQKEGHLHNFSLLCAPTKTTTTRKARNLQFVFLPRWQRNGASKEEDHRALRKGNWIVEIFQSQLTHRWRPYHVYGPQVLSPWRGWRLEKHGWEHLNGTRVRCAPFRGSCVANGGEANPEVQDDVLRVGRTLLRPLIHCPCSRVGPRRTVGEIRIFGLEINFREEYILLLIKVAVIAIVVVRV